MLLKKQTQFRQLILTCSSRRIKNKTELLQVKFDLLKNLETSPSILSTTKVLRKLECFCQCSNNYFIDYVLIFVYYFLQIKDFVISNVFSWVKSVLLRHTCIQFIAPSNFLGLSNRPLKRKLIQENFSLSVFCLWETFLFWDLRNQGCAQNNCLC